MKITVITLFPDLIRHYLNDALLSKAITESLIEINIIALRDFAEGNYKSVDEIPFGGGDGMVIKADVLEKAIKSLPTIPSDVIYLSPQGKTWSDNKARNYAAVKKEVVLICGRYAGIDQRFINRYVSEEISIGDYVLSGGELAALVLIESISRFIPGVLGKRISADNDSFADQLLEAPQFTRPQEWQQQSVPEVLTSGHHQKISDWKKNCSYLVTLVKRPELLAQSNINQSKLAEFYKTLSDADKKVLGIGNLTI